MAPAEHIAGKPRIALDTLNLGAAEGVVAEAALVAGSIVNAAELLGVTRQALKRIIVKHRIEWPRARAATEGMSCT